MYSPLPLLHEPPFYTYLETQGPFELCAYVTSLAQAPSPEIHLTRIVHYFRNEQGQRAEGTYRELDSHVLN